MQRAAMLMRSALVALLCLPGVAPPSAVAQQAPVARDFKELRVPGRVTAVVWTVREDRVTLQVVFPNSGRIAVLNESRQPQQAGGQAPRPPPKPVVEAWMLRADGSVIQPLHDRQIGTPSTGLFARHPYGIEKLYSFPLSVQSEATAVALRVDGVLKIEQLAPPTAD